MNQGRLILSNAQTSDANGNATFTIGPAEQSLVYQGTIQVPNAPSGALFIATVLNTNWGQFAGPTNFGEIQLWGGESLKVVATGLTPSTNYVLTMFGVALDENTADPIPPAAPMSVVSVETSTLLVNGQSVSSAGSVTVKPPTLTRRMTILLDTSGMSSLNTTIEVLGTTTHTNYFGDSNVSNGANQPPRFVAIEPAADASYTITFGAFTGTIKIWVLTSQTNPLIEGNPGSPIPVGPGSLNPIFTYPPISTADTGTFNSATPTTLTAAPILGVTFLGTITFYNHVSGAALVTVADTVNGTICKVFLLPGQSMMQNLELYTSGAITVAYVGAGSCDVTLTWGNGTTP